MEWAPAIVGVLLLVLGRRLYWLFVGGVGFVVGFSLASGLMGRAGGLTALLIGLGAGLLGVVLALILQRLAVVVAGFLAGGWLGVAIWGLFAPAPARFPWLPALLGAAAGALLAATLLDAVLVVLSSLVGAALLAGLVGGGASAQGIVFLGLAILGVVLQSGVRRREPPGPR